MLHPGLAFLVRLRMRAALRGFKRNLRSPMRAVVFAFGGLIALLWIGSLLFAGMNQGDTDVSWFQDALPFFILVMLIISLATSAGERAIYFSPAEIDFLFGGPFTRRQLLAYKLVGTTIGVTFSALIFSAVMRRYVPAWGPGFIGLWLALGFVQLMTMAVLLAGQSMAEAAMTKVRRIGVAAAVLFGAVVAWSAAYRVGAGSPEEVIRAMRNDSILRFVVLPVEPYVNVIFADPFVPNGLVWAAVCLAMNGAVCLFIYWLDAEYRETAINISQRWYARIQTAKKTGVAPPSSAKATGRMPMFPFFGGIGPIARRQLITAFRNSRSLLTVTGIIAVGLSISLMRGDRTPEQVWTLLFGMTLWLTVMLTIMVRFDFRSDLDQMEGLKALPIPAYRIAAGQLAVPVVVALVLQSVIIAVGAVMNNQPEVALGAAFFMIPVNMLLFGIENITFLFFPARVTAFNPGDFQVMGRQMLLLMLKFAVLGVAFGIAGIVGAAAFALIAESLWVFAAASWAVMIVLAVSVLPLMAFAFNRFDVSSDLPPA